VPEHLEFEPFADWNRVRAIIDAPKPLIGKAAIGFIVP
jgi:hypothetical protein